MSEPLRLTIKPGEILPSSGYVAARRHVGPVPVGEYVEYANGSRIGVADGFTLFVPVGQATATRRDKTVTHHYPAKGAQPAGSYTFALDDEWRVLPV